MDERTYEKVAQNCSFFDEKTKEFRATYEEEIEQTCKNCNNWTIDNNCQIDAFDTVLNQIQR